MMLQASGRHAVEVLGQYQDMLRRWQSIFPRETMAAVHARSELLVPLVILTGTIACYYDGIIFGKLSIDSAKNMRNFKYCHLPGNWKR